MTKKQKKQTKESKKSKKAQKDGFKHIVRVAKTDLPGEKPIYGALQKIKGVNFSFASAACNLADLDKNTKTGELTDKQIEKLTQVIENPKETNVPSWLLNRRRDYQTNEDKHLLMGDLDFTQDNDIKRMKKIKSYKGMRHSRGLPVRGQKTKANFRKNKGKASLGVQRKKVIAAEKKKEQ